MTDSELDEKGVCYRFIPSPFNIQEHQDFNDISKRRDDSVSSSVSDNCNNSKSFRLQINRQDSLQQPTFQSSSKKIGLQNFRSQIGASSRFIDASNNDVSLTFGQSNLGNTRKKGETIVSNHQTNVDESNIENNIPQLVEEKEPRRLMLAINLLVNVKGFYRRVTQNSRIFEKLSREQHNQIGDSSSFFIKGQFNQQKLDFKKLYCFYQTLYNHLDMIIQLIPICAPYSRFKQIWDLIQAILEMIVSFLFSLYIFFQLKVDSYSNLFLICFSFFFCDVLMNFNTGILQEGSVIYQRKMIAYQYIKGNFFFDMIGLVPFINYFWVGGVSFSNNELGSIIVSCLISMKWFSLGENFSKLSFFLSYQKNMKNSLDLVKLILLMLFVCHIFSLVWHGIAVYETNFLNRDDSWLHAYQLIDTDVWNRYLYSFYYLTVTMTTTGYGDISPKNSIEVLFSIVIIFTTAIFWAFFLNKIGQIIDNMEEKDKQYKSSMLVIHRLMREEEVDQELRVKISNYLKYIYKESNEIQKIQEKAIIETLSKQLRDDLILNMNGKYINKIPILEKLQQKDKLAQIMEECLFSPGEYIFKQNSVDDSSIYYIVKGSVSIIFEAEDTKRKESVICVLQKQQYFGEIGFIFDKKRAFSAKANNFCRLYKLQRQYFYQVIKDSEYDFENFEMIKESILMKDNYKFQQIRCFTCNQGNHLAQYCPKTHLTISKQVLINRHNYTQPQVERESFMRCKKKCNFRQICLIVHNAVFQINDNTDLFHYLDELEAGLNLSEQSDAYVSEQEFYSDYDLREKDVFNLRHDNDIRENSIIEQSNYGQSRSMVKKSTSTAVPLQPCRQSQDVNGNMVTGGNNIQIDQEKIVESMLTSQSSVNSSSSQDSSKDSGEKTNTNQESMSSKVSAKKYTQSTSINQNVTKNQSLQNVQRLDSKKLSHIQDQSSQTFRNPSSLFPVTVIPPSQNGHSHEFNQNKKNLQDSQNLLLKQDMDIQTLGGGTHIGSLTSLTSRSRVPSRLACGPDKDRKMQTNNSFIDANYLNNNDQIRSLTKISTASNHKERNVQSPPIQNNNQQPNYNHRYTIFTNSNKVDTSVVRRSQTKEKPGLNNRLSIQPNVFKLQIEELLSNLSSNKKNTKQEQMSKQKTRARGTISADKLSSQLKQLSNQKTGFTFVQNTKNPNPILANPQVTPNVEEQILSAIKLELENQEENEDEMRDLNNYMNLIEFDKIRIYKYYHKNDNYIIAIERWQDYWNKTYEIHENKKKQRKKQSRSRFKSKALFKSKNHIN